MTCVDGFVAAVPTANKETYRLHAEEAATPSAIFQSKHTHGGQDVR